MPTPSSNENYVRHLGQRCPTCGAYRVVATRLVETDDASAWQEMICFECNATWQDIYKLVGYDNLKGAEDDTAQTAD